MIVVFTDLDGTLLDENYSYEAAKPALNYLLRSNIPIVFCSSKTRAEIEVYRREMGIKDPFISENGAAIFIPKYYFDFPYAYTKQLDDYNVIELGTEYSVLRETLERIRRTTGYEIVGFGDMTVEEVARDCGLSLKEAKLAKLREYDEAFSILEGDEREILRLIREAGLNYTKGGRYYHIIGNNDKGRAVHILTELYSKKFKDVKTIGIGDSLNDLPMLMTVDIPVLVKKRDGTYDMDIERIMEGKLLKAEGIGPSGWKWAIENIVIKGKGDEK
ncbi:MAG: mannosyl-3-phosphoglycerate phosphatase [Candidatus Alkanophagales archaeon]|nr:MAG: mannosyl-3-phosphoglycerate phosphatase [Candidatus Alkanophagales archaeon]